MCRLLLIALWAVVVAPLCAHADTANRNPIGYQRLGEKHSRYRAFGERINVYATNPARTDPTFQGRTYDSGLGIYDYRNRSFDPSTGRFLQRDPVLGGDPLYNPYCFPGNNPVSNTDPMGLGWEATSQDGVDVWVPANDDERLRDNPRPIFHDGKLYTTATFNGVIFAYRDAATFDKFKKHLIESNAALMKRLDTENELLAPAAKNKRDKSSPARLAISSWEDEIIQGEARENIKTWKNGVSIIDVLNLSDRIELSREKHIPFVRMGVGNLFRMIQKYAEDTGKSIELFALATHGAGALNGDTDRELTAKDIDAMAQKFALSGKPIDKAFAKDATIVLIGCEAGKDHDELLRALGRLVPEGKVLGSRSVKQLKAVVVNQDEIDEYNKKIGRKGPRPEPKYVYHLVFKGEPKEWRIYDAKTDQFTTERSHGVKEMVNVE